MTHVRKIIHLTLGPQGICIVIEYYEDMITVLTKVEDYKLTYEFQKFSRYKLPRDLLHSS